MSGDLFSERNDPHWRNLVFGVVMALAFGGCLVATLIGGGFYTRGGGRVTWRENPLHFGVVVLMLVVGVGVSLFVALTAFR